MIAQSESKANTNGKPCEHIEEWQIHKHPQTQTQTKTQSDNQTKRNTNTIHFCRDKT